MYNFVSVLRQPDNAIGATEKSPYRFEEDAFSDCPVKFDYLTGDKSSKVVVYPSGAPVKYLKLRFRGDMSGVSSVYGDVWERSSPTAVLEWRSVNGGRAMPWFCYAKAGEQVKCYGVKTGADCFAFWQIDPYGVTLFLNLTCDARGTDLKEPLVACEVVELLGAEGEDAYKVACRFAQKMCDNPVNPKNPVFGVNNWYWAYGDITRESVLRETDYLMEMTCGVKNKPYMIIDDGWQINRTFGEYGYIGGEWKPSAKFGDMAETCDKIHEKGANAGLWFRPLLTIEKLPEEVFTAEESHGRTLDPSHPLVLEKVKEDAKRIADWGFDLIKHDFSTMDALGLFPCAAENFGELSKNRRYYDNSKTTATIIKNLYKAIQSGAGKADIIGCNVFGHLSAGIHSLQRVGADTSGRSFEWTRADGVNSVMRLPQNGTFWNVDPDCAAFTARVDGGLNLDFLEMCAITGMTTLASVTPYTLNEEELKRINAIFKIADAAKERYGIKNYDKNSLPDTFVNEEGTEKKFNWYRIYDGARTVLNWFD